MVSRAAEARDPYTAGHQLRVSRLAREIAQEMGLDSDRVEGIRLGAQIHDIGKIQVPSELLSKPGKLSANEFELIKEHCLNGYNILKDVEFPWPIAEISYQHHERLDGSGYPQGLKGDAICLEARIVAVADVVEAISSHRPYRPSLGNQVALDEIATKRGKHYDPKVVDACLKIFTEKKFSFDAL
ncbi:MAG: HD-GYP domain-containing protein [Gallionellaceae bacterium]|nr:HD-GYP domain-containing protein [Gallionellaceae bacterium]